MHIKGLPPDEYKLEGLAAVNPASASWSESSKPKVEKVKGEKGE